VGALTNPQVGDFVNRNFVSTYVKVGTFQLVNGQKQGGNVATYFCTTDGKVLHAIAGPVDANSFLYESRWAVNVAQRAGLEGRESPERFRQVVREAHTDRLDRDYGITRATINRMRDSVAEGDGGFTGKGTNSWLKKQFLRRHQNGWAAKPQVHLLNALFPMEKIEDVYQYVFETILNEKVSSLPVVEK
jgi:hypothetical protein